MKVKVVMAMVSCPLQSMMGSAQMGFWLSLYEAVATADTLFTID